MVDNCQRTKICTFPESKNQQRHWFTNWHYIMEKKIEDGVVIANELFEVLDARGKKWRKRNVPVYVRENLWIPYYTTTTGGVTRLFVIRPPDPTNPKVHFREY